MKYDLFITDFDGTLGVVPDVVDAETVTAIKKYIKKGGKFVICTGRMACSAHHICKKYGFGGLTIAYQGATIDDMDNNQRILSAGIESELAISVVKQLKQQEVCVCVAIDEILYCEVETAYTEFYKNFTTVVVVEDLISLIQNSNKPVLKVVGTSEPEKIKEVTQKLTQILPKNLSCNNGIDYLVEIINKEYDKGSAVRFLSKYYNIPYDRIITVGDSNNDIPLLDGDWHGVAVGDAKDSLKKVAKEITVDFKDNPVKYLLEKYCL